MNTVLQGSTTTILQSVKPDKTYTISMVRPEQCFMVWKKVREWLAPAVERSHGRWTMEHLFAALCLGQQNLWIAYDAEGHIDGALTTQLVQYPNNSMVACQFLGGTNFDLWSSDMLDMIKHYAKDMGAQGVEAIARFGFWPFFKSEGFTRSYAVFEQ